MSTQTERDLLNLRLLEMATKERQDANRSDPTPDAVQALEYCRNEMQEQAGFCIWFSIQRKRGNPTAEYFSDWKTVNKYR